MASRKSIDRALVAEVFKRLMIEIEEPMLSGALGPHDVEAAIRGIDAFVDRLMTKATPSTETKRSAPPVEYTAGTKPVLLRVPNRVINAFRAASVGTGTGYQTLMIRALTDAAEGTAL